MNKINEFVQIKNCPNYYINNQGIVLSKSKGFILKQLTQVMSNCGYMEVRPVNTEGKRLHSTIHRLVAEHFIPNPNNYSDVNHIDEDKTNNDVSNLEWCTRSQNCQKYYDNNKRPHSRKVNLYSSGVLIGEFKSINQACRYVNDNIEPINITSMANNIRLSPRPYKKKYSVKVI